MWDIRRNRMGKVQKNLGKGLISWEKSQDWYHEKMGSQQQVHAHVSLSKMKSSTLEISMKQDPAQRLGSVSGTAVSMT